MTELVPPGCARGLAAALLFSLSLSGALDAAPIRERPPLPVGSKWKGKLTQKGEFPGGETGPPSFETTLVVTAREGTRFEAELSEQSEGVRITYLVKGELTADGKTVAVSFRSIGSKNVFGTVPILGVPYTGSLAGKSLKGSWKLPRKGADVEVAGDFLLELSE